MKTEIETNNLINLGWFYDNAVYYDMKTKKLYKSNLKKNSTGIMLLTPIFSNSLFFIKFIEFQPSLNGKNYYIGEN
ncbi:hypothetical protein SaSA16_1457 [Streptococcus agalactiae]|nr:hypothetical protein SaSA33_1461 [Streptococcus agalactiae]AUO92420.1 hypothetical protein SaSA16_1457 [Streptococcus agalactiae]AUO95747.1 hypothetical protein SaSA79_1463 [Streptococcus agalactiae]AUO99047.1 hypothetical protein SaSA85_1468 [Streptococcus agalactiae]AUP07114.1 hypothetical protein SaSA136_1460 [Streptococcus agalactiae]